MNRAITRWLASTMSGRVTLQLAIAALLLIAALAPRAIRPVPSARIARRSPLEHVVALALAYEQVRATRTAARLLLQGLRRRASRSVAPRNASDDGFLAAVAVRDPALAPDVARVRHAVAQTVPASELLDAVASIDRIDRSVRP